MQESISLFILEKTIISNNTQQIISKLTNFPMLHFSSDADKIVNEGFKHGTQLENIDCSFDNLFEKIKNQEGYIYAFNPLNTTHFDDNLSFPDYEISLHTNLCSMFFDKAVLFLGNGLYTQHPDGFNQVITHNHDLSLDNAILLEQIILKESISDEDGNDIDSIWIASFKNKKIVNEDKYCNIQECVGYSLKYLIQQNIIQDQNIIELFKTEYEGIINTKINQKKNKYKF